MRYSQENINFTSLSGTLFEELCFELLLRLGFQSLTWRQGGADSGRDLEAIYYESNPLVGQYIEKWHFECKNYSQGVSVEDLASKVAWADAEKPDHLVFLISSYPTNDCREWIKKIQASKSFKIHTVDGQILKRLVLNHNELVERYFLNGLERIFRNAIIDWQIADIFPDPERLTLFLGKLNIDRIDEREAAFLAVAYCCKIEDIHSWESDKEGHSMPINILLQWAQSNRNIDTVSLLKELKYRVRDNIKMATRGNAESQVVIRTISIPIEYRKKGRVYIGCYISLSVDDDVCIDALMSRHRESGENDVHIQLIRRTDRILPYGVSEPILCTGRKWTAGDPGRILPIMGARHREG